MIETKVKTIRQVSEVTLPDGVYNGTWGGYVVTLEFDDGTKYELHTENGIRTMAAPCVVTVKDGKANVRTK